jgi:uracil-xanthine permease
MATGIDRIWKVHGDGRTVQPGEVVRPDERLNLPAMLGLGGQHILAMFGATALVPVLTGFPVTTTIFFSGVGTILFNLMTRNRVPSYTGSSFAFIAPVLAAKTESLEAALGGIMAAGIALFLVGLLVDRAGYPVIEFLLPPVVTGSIVALIGLNLAPVAEDQFTQQAGIAMVTLVSILIIGVAVKGFLSRLSVFLGVVVGYVFAALLGEVNWDAVHAADWFGLPDFITPEINGRAIVLIVPAVLLVLLAENAGHVKAVATMTEQDLDPYIGRSFMGDGVATTLSGLFGGSGTTTYAENIGVMGYTRIYSTLAYLIAGAIAIALGLLPKFGAIISAIPVGVLGGAVTVLFGMIAVLGGRIWIEGRVNFRDPVNLVTAAVALIVGAGNYVLTWGDYEFAGIALGTIAAIAIYQVLRWFQPEIRGEEGGAFGDPLVEPLARTPDPRRPDPA